MNGLDFGTAIGLIKGLGSPDPAVIESAVSDWLDDHPEATTTVQDGSITKAKLDSNLQGTVDDVANLKSQKADVDLALGAYPTDTVSGAVASFADGGDSLPVKDLTIGIEPVQSGSGDPSPTNIRPISGWTRANINANGTTYPITFPTEAGTVYGGTLDVTTGVLTVDKNIITLRGGFYKHPTLENSFYQNNILNDCAAGKCVSNLFAYSTVAFGYMPLGCFTIDTNYTRVAIRTNNDITANEFNAMLLNNQFARNMNH